MKNKRWKCYICHAQRGNEIKHYFGVTQQNSIEHRIKQHLGEDRGQPIKAWKRDGFELSWRLLVPQGSKMLERYLQSASEPLVRAKICPICAERGLGKGECWG